MQIASKVQNNYFFINFTNKITLPMVCFSDSLNFVMNVKKMTQRGLNNELRLAVSVAEHLFGKLAVHQQYTLNNQRKFSKIEHLCHCGCKTPVLEKFGNTTIGIYLF